MGFSRKRGGAPGLSSTHRGKKAPLKSFASYCTTRIRCSGAADGTAGPDRARENSRRTLRAEGEGGRKGDRTLERRGEEEGCGEPDRKTQVRERETRGDGGAEGRETRRDETDKGRHPGHQAETSWGSAAEEGTGYHGNALQDHTGCPGCSETTPRLLPLLLTWGAVPKALLSDSKVSDRNPLPPCPSV